MKQTEWAQAVKTAPKGATAIEVISNGKTAVVPLKSAAKSLDGVDGTYRFGVIQGKSFVAFAGGAKPAKAELPSERLGVPPTTPDVDAKVAAANAAAAKPEVKAILKGIASAAGGVLAEEKPAAKREKKPKAKVNTDTEPVDRMPTTIAELKESKSGLVTFLFLSGRDKDEIAKELQATFKLAEAQAVKIVRRITGRARFFRRAFDLMAVK